MIPLSVRGIDCLYREQIDLIARHGSVCLSLSPCLAICLFLASCIHVSLVVSLLKRSRGKEKDARELMLYLPTAFPLRIAGASAIAVQPWGAVRGLLYHYYYDPRDW